MPEQRPPKEDAPAPNSDAYRRALFQRLSLGAVQASPTAEVRKKSLQEQEEDQLWWLRYSIAFIVVFTLWNELFWLFWIIIWHARGGNFQISEWLIGLLVVGVLVQTFWSLDAIIVHVFSRGGDKLGTVPKSPDLSGK